jgi:hypothetical protein
MSTVKIGHSAIVWQYPSGKQYIGLPLANLHIIRRLAGMNAKNDGPRAVAIIRVKEIKQ